MKDDVSNSRKLHFGLYVLALTLALAVRLARLEAWPLSDEEARWAMQSLDLLRGLRPEVGPQPLYVWLTALAFFVLQASAFAARLVPALFGTALVLAPYFFRDRLGDKAALVLAFWLAFEPGLLAISRLAGSPMLVVSALVLAWGAWRQGKFRVAGVLAGLALLAGPQLWPGLLGLLIASGLRRGLFAAETTARVERQDLICSLAYAAGTFLVAGSFFLLAPGGLGAGLQSVAAYFSGWIEFNGVPAQRLLLALLVYEFPALILALAALVRGILRRDELTIALGFWLLAALVLAIANPGRQVFDLAWALLPLTALAALEVARHINPIEDGAWETLGMMAFTMALLAFSALNFTSIALWSTEASTLRWVLLAASLLLLGLTIFMVAYGWSVSVAVQGSVWGAFIMLGVYALSAAMAAGGLRVDRTVELWTPGLRADYASAFTSQVDEISQWKLAPAMPLEITVAGVDSPALRWALRKWNVTVSASTVLTASPDIVIVPGDAANPELQAGYRGQDFIWRTEPLWDQLSPPDWLRWALRHTALEGQETLILWVRSDLFIDSQNKTP